MNDTHQIYATITVVMASFDEVVGGDSFTLLSVLDRQNRRP